MSGDTTVLAILATVLSGVGGAGMLMLRSQQSQTARLLDDVLATNKALREALARMGERFRDHLEDDRLSADMIEDIHRAVVGAKRTSEYSIEREKIRARNRPNGGEGT